MLKHLFYPPENYDAQRPVNSWWQESTPAVNHFPTLENDTQCDVAIVGAGYTGLNAALTLCKDHRLKVCVLEQGHPGWGASGRNGGFVTYGGIDKSLKQIAREFGEPAAQHYADFQMESIQYVDHLIDSESLSVDRQGRRELWFAGSARRRKSLLKKTSSMAKYGQDVRYLETAQLSALGVDHPSFSAAWSAENTFSLQPMKYAQALAQLASRAGVAIYSESQVEDIEQQPNQGYLLATRAGSVRAEKVLIATNGYTPEGLPLTLERALLPVYSNILVTAPISDAKYLEQGWDTYDMGVTGETLIHYFRRLPDGRFMFGGRGGTRGTAVEKQQNRQRLIGEFYQHFPLWRDVPISHFWDGLICLAGDRLTHLGKAPASPGLFYSCAYHGSGVPMGSYCGKKIADWIAGQAGAEQSIPEILRQQPTPIPFPRLRQLYLRSAYAYYGLKERLRPY